MTRTRSGAFFMQAGEYYIRAIARRSIIWTHAEVKRFMTRRRGNPNWGRPMLPASVLCTEFELQVKQLHLTADHYVVSADQPAMKHLNIRWNPAIIIKEWFCTKCGRTSDHISVQDAHVELDQYDCQVPSVGVPEPDSPEER